MVTRTRSTQHTHAHADKTNTCTRVRTLTGTIHVCVIVVLSFSGCNSSAIDSCCILIAHSIRRSRVHRVRVDDHSSSPITAAEPATVSAAVHPPPAHT